MTYWCVGVWGLVSWWGEGGLRARSVFQRNEAAQDVPVALVTKLLLFFFFSVRMKHHFKHFPVQTSLPAWQKQICVPETHTPFESAWKGPSPPELLLHRGEDDKIEDARFPSDKPTGVITHQYSCPAPSCNPERTDKSRAPPARWCQWKAAW